MAAYQLNSTGFIIRASDGACIPPDPTNTDYAVYLEWCNQGNTADPAPAPSNAALTEQYTQAIQDSLDAYAQSWGYDHIVSAASYVNSTVAKFKNEGTALLTWRDQVWEWAEAELAAILAGTTPVPTDMTAFLSGMPAKPARPV